MSPDEIDEIHAAIAEAGKENKDRERRPDQVEMICLILAVIFIVVLTCCGAPVWTAPIPMLPNLGKTGMNFLTDLLSGKG